MKLKNWSMERKICKSLRLCFFSFSFSVSLGSHVSFGINSLKCKVLGMVKCTDWTLLYNKQQPKARWDFIFLNSGLLLVSQLELRCVSVG